MRVGIIGAGISGLSLAHYLKKKNHQVFLFESSSQVGGPVRSSKCDNFLIEYGPNSLLMTTDSINELIQDVGLADELVKSKPEAKFRFIVKDGKLIALPTSLSSFLKTSLFSLKAKLRLLKEPFISKGENPNESLADFVERRLGKEFLDYAINPFVAGVYAGDPKTLSVRHAFKKLYDLEQGYGSLIKGQLKGAKERKKSGEVAKNRAPMVSFKNGLGSLISALEKSLEKEIYKNSITDGIFKVNDGWSISLPTRAEPFEVDKLIITIPTHRLRELPFSILHDDKRPIFKEVYYPPVTVVHTGYERKTIQHDLNGFGYLTPEKEGRFILGSLFASSIFEGRSDSNHALLTSFIGGARSPENAFKEDEELIEEVFKDHQQLIGATEKPIFTEVIRWKQAIPQYTLEYDIYVDAVKQMELSNPGLYFSGNWVNGISLSDSISKAHDLAERISQND